MIRALAFIFLLLLSGQVLAGDAQPLFEKGWDALVRDRDAEAFGYFSKAYDQALAGGDLHDQGEALLNMGICSYGASHSRGLRYAYRALSTFRRLEKSDPAAAVTGRSRCLQLISTIRSRQGRYRQAIALSREALHLLPATDNSGSRGLMYNSLGNAYAELDRLDSSDYFYRLGLEDHLAASNSIYLPGSLLNVAGIELRLGHIEQSRRYFDRSLQLAEKTQNRQAMVSAMLGLGRWQLAAGDNEAAAEALYRRAETIAVGLTDRAFQLKVLEHWLLLCERQGDYKAALSYQQQMNDVRASLFATEKQALREQLEAQLALSEKERSLALVRKEKDIAALTNALLWGTLVFIAIAFAGAVRFMRRIHRRDRQLLRAGQELTTAREEQRRLSEQQLQTELRHKESELSSLALQMVQKNDWLNELKQRVEQGTSGTALAKLLDKELDRDQEWSDFDRRFEHINTNFYRHLKQEYPDINPNDLKLCALIRLNLSIKEMASLLNISPDSVKTARYRLRKKLCLNSEDNLTDFILNLS